MTKCNCACIGLITEILGRVLGFIGIGLVVNVCSVIVLETRIRHSLHLSERDEPSSQQLHSLAAPRRSRNLFTARLKLFTGTSAILEIGN
ncbi:unnamed protein product [Microthlaspi erraticum]|uniref:Uncharacterized protein n=1 Tax=Microthlaspi erraticum TaxID=1685480 RepID=A0A6D2JPU0_9BRAS|nr:unnamed protein product [Microthlaspi erraticum]